MCANCCVSFCGWLAGAAKVGLGHLRRAGGGAESDRRISRASCIVAKSSLTFPYRPPSSPAGLAYRSFANFAFRACSAHDFNWADTQPHTYTRVPRSFPSSHCRGAKVYKWVRVSFFVVFCFFFCALFWGSFLPVLHESARPSVREVAMAGV